jgi:hypothetical protein
MSREQSDRAYLAACVREGRPMGPDERERAAKMIERSGRPANLDTQERRFIIAHKARLLLNKGLTVDAMHDEIGERWGVSPRYIDNARAGKLHTVSLLFDAVAKLEDGAKRFHEEPEAGNLHVQVCALSSLMDRVMDTVTETIAALDVARNPRKTSARK